MLAGKTIALIAAVARNGAIGRDGDMPWHLPADLRHFKAITLDHTLVMGRKTFQSIGRPLPGRQNIVITRNRRWRADGVLARRNLEAAVREAFSDPVFVIGGGEIYAAALPFADELHLTEIDAEIEDADTFFPEFDRQDWTEVERTAQPAGEANPLDLSFVRYRRMPRGAPP